MGENSNRAVLNNGEGHLHFLDEFFFSLNCFNFILLLFVDVVSKKKKKKKQNKTKKQILMLFTLSVSRKQINKCIKQRSILSLINNIMNKNKKSAHEIIII